MTAAVKTPSVVCRVNVPIDAITGTAPRIVEYYIEVTKETQSDWILLETAIGDTTKTIVGYRGVVLDSSSDLAGETLTYDDSEDKLVLAGATVGTAKLFVRMKNA